MGVRRRAAADAARMHYENNMSRWPNVSHRGLRSRCKIGSVRCDRRCSGGRKMPSEDRLLLLKQGVGAWNAWRKENPTEGADLSKANLSGVDLREADLSGTYLDEANLKGANLSKANLNNAYLSGADFSDANLGEAKLIQASLNKA